MFARTARSIGIAAGTCLAGAVLTIVTLQLVERRWSLHAILDLGAVVTVMGATAAALICLPIFVLLRRSVVVSTRLRAAVLGAVCAGLSGPVAFAWFFGDDVLPRTVAQWLLVVGSPLALPFVTAGAAFGTAWARGNRVS